MKAIVGEVDIGIYNVEVHYVFAENLAAAGKAFWKAKPETKEATLDFFNTEDDDQNDMLVTGLMSRYGHRFVVYICNHETRLRRGLSKINKDLAHELQHVTLMTLESVGMSHNEDSEEAYTYLIGYMVERLSSAFFYSLRNRKDLKRLMK